jgi:hypothetical protein
LHEDVVELAFGGYVPPVLVADPRDATPLWSHLARREIAVSE